MLPGHDEAPVVAIAVAAALVLCLWWLGRAIVTAREGEREPELPPTCEGCGYDLTHVPDSGRCSECGLNTDASLVPGVRRRPIAWESPGGPRSWQQAAFTALFMPRDFYAGSCFKTPDGRAARFAVWNYILIGLVAVGWAIFAAIALILRHGPGPSAIEAALLISLFSSVTVLACWLGHRTIGALVTTWWLICGRLPDYRRAAKVIAYESVFLWVFCTFWGMTATSFILWEDWLSRLLGSSMLFSSSVMRMPAEVLLVLGGTAALGLVWLWRYAIAGRGVRWASF